MLVSLVLSCECLGDSSSSDHLSASSPTAKIVSPSNDCRGSRFSLTGFGGIGDKAPLLPPPLGLWRSGDRASSSSREPPKDAISKPSSSCASCIGTGVSHVSCGERDWTGKRLRVCIPRRSWRTSGCWLLVAIGRRRKRCRTGILCLAIRQG